MLEADCAVNSLIDASTAFPHILGCPAEMHQLFKPINNASLAVFRILFGLLIATELRWEWAARVGLVEQRPIRFPYMGFEWLTLHANPSCSQRRFEHPQSRSVKNRTTATANRLSHAQSRQSQSIPSERRCFPFGNGTSPNRPS